MKKKALTDKEKDTMQELEEFYSRKKQEQKALKKLLKAQDDDKNRKLNTGKH